MLALFGQKVGLEASHYHAGNVAARKLAVVNNKTEPEASQQATRLWESLP